MGLCKFCNKWITQPEGKRKKEFCNNTCRSNFWYGQNKKGKSVEKLESKIVFVSPTPESFDAPKISRLLSDEAGQWAEPLSFDKLKQGAWEQTPVFAPVSVPVVMKRYWDEKRELTADEYPEWLSRLYSDERLTQKQKDLIKNTNQHE